MLGVLFGCLGGNGDLDGTAKADCLSVRASLGYRRIQEGVGVFSCVEVDLRAVVDWQISTNRVDAIFHLVVAYCRRVCEMPDDTSGFVEGTAARLDADS